MSPTTPPSGLSTALSRTRWAGRTPTCTSSGGGAAAPESDIHSAASPSGSPTRSGPSFGSAPAGKRAFLTTSPNRQTRCYRYDFGDDRHHRVVLEAKESRPEVGASACLGGQRAGPPEDIGGVSGHESLVAFLSAYFEESSLGARPGGLRALPRLRPGALRPPRHHVYRPGETAAGIAGDLTGRARPPRFLRGRAHPAASVRPRRGGRRDPKGRASARAVSRSRPRRLARTA